MKTPRTVLKIDQNEPGTEIAAETAAAMAAASIVFRSVDHTYSRRLLNKAKLVLALLSIYNQFLYIYILLNVIELTCFWFFFACSCSNLPKHIKGLLMENAHSTAHIQATM